MGFFDKLFGSSLQTPSSSEELRRLLFEAAQAGHAKLVGKYCAKYRAWIMEHFESWATVPNDVRKDNTALNNYANGLIAVATTIILALPVSV